jgi:hypothetical protein
MNAKVEKIIREFAWKGMIRANNINKKMSVDLGEKRLTKWLEKYIKFLDITFKIITGITISLVFLWFLPTYLKLSYDRIIVILLVVILLQMRFSGIKVKLE